MQSAIEKLREYRYEDYHSHNETIELWTKILADCDLSTLGDEKWLILKQVFKSALHCSNQSIALQCLEQLGKQFKETSPRVITLHAMYFESVGEFDKAQEIYSTLTADNETDVVKKLINLINHLLDVCENLPDIPLTCLNTIKKYSREINESLINENILDNMKDCVIQIKDFIQTINLNDIQQEKLNNIVLILNTCICRLSNEVNTIKKQLINIEHENQDMKIQLIDVKKKNHEKEKILENKLDNLFNEINRLKNHASQQIVDDVFAHLLIPFINQLKEELNKKKKEENDPNSNSFEFKNCYNGYVLDQIRTTAHVKGPIFFVKKIIVDFCQQARIELSDMIQLLAEKQYRNFKCHRIVDQYVNEHHQQNFIEYLQSKHAVEILVDDRQKELLNKLVLVNIEMKTNQRSIKSIIDEYLHVSEEHDTNGSFRMPIAELFKDMGTIVTGKIESGRVHVGDECWIMPNRTRVQVTNIYCGDIETDFGVYEENVRLKLINAEEEKILPGFVLCDGRQKPCRVGRTFESEVTIINHQSKIYPGYSAFLHIHTAVAEVRLKRLLTLIDRKTGEETIEDPKFIKQDQAAFAIFELSQSGQTICMELFEEFPRLGRFALCNEGRTVAVGKVRQIMG